MPSPPNQPWFLLNKAVHSGAGTAVNDKSEGSPASCFVCMWQPQFKMPARKTDRLMAGKLGIGIVGKY
jgi:hypothetical protein